MLPETDLSRRNFLKQLSLTSIALLPATQALGELIDNENLKAPPLGTPFFIDAAFRLMYYQQMLELEFYFVNVSYDELGRRLCPLAESNSRYRAYMVVRLPQQHIAEEYVDATCLRENPDKEYDLRKTRIAGYSYLCFSIDFAQLLQGLPVQAAELMDWNAAHFSLISKPGLNIKPFIYDSHTSDRLLADPADVDLLAPDMYPLSYLTEPATKKKKYARRYYPNQRNYAGGLRSNRAADMRAVRDQTPFTALEIPYRLILSPRLPSWEYDYHWIFTSFLGVSTCPRTPASAELWMATLTLRRKKGHSLNAARATQPAGAQTRSDAPGNAPPDSEETVNPAENQLQLMILGPADRLQFDTGELKPTGLEPDASPRPLGFPMLPSEQDRLDLVRLSLNFDLPATTPALTFTPLGVCTQLAFRNTYFERDRISLYQWKQAISFGRDQEVEVANVVVDATFGLKMLHVRTTRRETVKGRTPLIYREFLMPLELEKDFASYSNQDGRSAYQQENHKYATPFQRVRFPDAAPRQILPLRRLQSDLCVRVSQQAQDAQAALRSSPAGLIAAQQQQAANRVNGQKVKTDGFENCPEEPLDVPVLAFWAVSPDHRLLEWPMVFTDWRGQETTLRRRLYLLKSELNLDRDATQRPVYGLPKTGDAGAAALMVGAHSTDIIPHTPQGTVNTAVLQLLASRAGMAEAVAAIWQALDAAPTGERSARMQAVFKRLWVFDSNGTWQPDLAGIDATMAAGVPAATWTTIQQLLVASGTRQPDLAEVYKTLTTAGVSPAARTTIQRLLWKFANGTWQPDLAGIEAALTAAGVSLPTRTAIKELLTAENPWNVIRQQTEEFGLHTLDALRGGIAEQLLAVEDKLVAISTVGARDVEDAVLEEWGRCKRRLLGPALTWENELWSLLHLAEDLARQVRQVLAEARVRAGAALEAAATELLGKLGLFLSNDLPASCYRQTTAFLNELKQSSASLAKLQADAQALANSLITELRKLQAAAEKVVSNYKDFAAAVQQAGERIQRGLLTEMGATYEQAQFIGRLPALIRQEVREGIDGHLTQLRGFGAYIGHFERACKSRIDAEKALVCYAVHQATDEMEVLKRALNAKWQEKHPTLSLEALHKTADWLRDFEAFGKDFGYAAAGHLATMHTDFLVFRTNLRRLETQVTTVVAGVEQVSKTTVFDLFSSYPCYPQLHTAQVYADTINDLARCEIPLKIKYAQEYVRNQLDNVGLEVKNNAARLFAEVHHETQELLKGALREAGKELGGLVNPEVASRYLTLLKDGSARAQATLDTLRQDGETEVRKLADDLRQASGQVLTTANAALNELLQAQYAKAPLQAYRQEFDRLRNGLVTLSEAAKQELKAAERDLKVQASTFFQGLEAKILGSIRLRDLLGVDFNLPKLTRLPDKVTYQFLTRNFRPFDVKVFRFVPNERTTLAAYLEIPTRNPASFRSQTQLSNFTLSIFGDRLLVEFKRIELLSTPDVKNKTSVELGQIGFGKELEFLAALAKGFMLPGTGLKVEPSPSDISITYALPIPGVSGGAFTFDNLKVNAGISIPIPTGLGAANQPLGIKFGLNSPTDPFAIGVLIFGGLGHFLIETTPKYLKRVDTGLSFGGLFRINLGIAVGQAYLQAGIRYVYERQPTGEAVMELYGLLTCGANVTVFGFIDISVVFTMYLKYRKDSAGAALYGVASVSCSVRVGFFRKSFTLTFAKRIAGASTPPARQVPAPAARPRHAPPPADAAPLPLPPVDDSAAPDAELPPTAARPPAPPSPTGSPVRRIVVTLPEPTERDRRYLNHLEKRRKRALQAVERRTWRLAQADYRLAEARRREYERRAARYQTADVLSDQEVALDKLKYLYETYSFDQL